MPRYRYRGIDAEGRRAEGEVDADHLAEAAAKVESMGVAQAAVEPAAEPPGRLRARRVRLEDLVQFNTQLAGMARAGIPLDQALGELSREMRRGRLRSAVEAVVADVREGTALADAMARHEGALPPAYVEVVRAGLAAGNLPEVLLLLNQRLTLQQEFHRQVVDAFSYPLLVCVLALGVVFGMLIFIRPAFSALFQEYAVGTPWTTQTYLELSAVAPTLLLVVLSAAALVALGFLATAGSRAGRRLRELLLGIVPYYRRMRRVAVSGELCASLAMFLKAGLTVPQALRMAARTTTSERLGRAVGRACERVEAGEPLDHALAPEAAVPRLVVHAVRVGTSRGDLPEVLEGMAETYRRQGERAMAIARLVLPLVGVVFAGAAVGFAGLSLVLPLFQIMQEVRGI